MGKVQQGNPLIQNTTFGIKYGMNSKKIAEPQGGMI